jgi:hypothetical protein
MSTTESSAPATIAVPSIGPSEAVLLHTVSVPVVTPQPITSGPVPEHPYMAPNGRSNMHNDAYMSDSYTWRGPAGGELQVKLGVLDGLCATLTFDSQGRIVTVRTRVRLGVKRDLLLLDPHTLAVLASYELPGGGVGGSGFGSGGYIYLDHQDRPVIPTADQTVMIFDLVEPEGSDQMKWVPAAVYNVASAIGDSDASIQSAIPDWSGNIWFVTDTGKVGFVNPATGAAGAMQLPSPETIGNSFAVDQTGGVFIVSDYAQYRFDVGPDGGPAVTWRYTYDRGSELKPGQVNFGSGTTPTLIGDQWLGITDNADPQMHVVVYRRELDFQGNRKAAEIPVFKPGQSDTENSLIAAGDTFIVENNYGYTGTYNAPTGPVTPGMARVAWPLGGFGETVWSSDQVVVPSVVSKVSLADGLVYSYVMEQANGRTGWSVAAVRASDGQVAWKAPTGEGLEFDNHYAGLFVGPDGTVYVPVWAGIVSVSHS